MLELQWGHVFSDVEIEKMSFYFDEVKLLQWGHVFSDVEISLCFVISTTKNIASMGPRLFRRGNRKESAHA